MTDPATRTQHYWERRLAPAREGGVDGSVLAALRRGIGREAGTVPQMWPFYCELSPRGDLTRALRAEHLTLALFAVHQQSKRQPVHHTGAGVGRALAALRTSDRYHAQAVDRRFATFATATSLAEAGTHLRGLITQLRQVEHARLDYNALFRDLIEWQSPARTGQVRRRWGSAYFTTRSAEETDSAPNDKES